MNKIIVLNVLQFIFKIFKKKFKKKYNKILIIIRIETQEL